MLRVQNREKLYLLREGETIRCFREHEKPQGVDLEQVENEEQLEECLNTFALLDNIEQCNSVQKVVDVSEAKLHWDMLDYEFAAEHKKGI